MMRKITDGEHTINLDNGDIKFRVRNNRIEFKCRYLDKSDGRYHERAMSYDADDSTSVDELLDAIQEFHDEIDSKILIEEEELEYDV